MPDQAAIFPGLHHRRADCFSSLPNRLKNFVRLATKLTRPFGSALYQSIANAGLRHHHALARRSRFIFDVRQGCVTTAQSVGSLCQCSKRM